MTCVAFKDMEGVAALDRKDLSGNLLDVVKQAENFVERNTRTGFRIKGFRRENFPDYPIEADYLMRAHGLKKPKIEATEGFFTIIFPGPKKPEAVIPDSSGLNGRQKVFLEDLKREGLLTRSDYETTTKASKRTAIRDLQDLVVRGVIIDVSTSKTDPNRRYKLAQ